MQKSALQSCTAICALIAVAPAIAQEAETDAAPGGAARTELASEPGNTIVVTARLREETLQDAPLSIVAISEDELFEQRIDTMQGLAAAVPSLNVSDPFGRNNPSFSLRGIGLAGIGEELPVGIFIDGVYVSGRSSASLILTDLDRVEVVRGPQSALYGRNTFAGAINFITKKPSNELEGYAEATAGTKDRYLVRAGVSGPIAEDLLSAHVGVVYRDWGGFYENQVPGGPELNRQKTFATNLQLRFTPSPDWDATFRFIYADDDDTNPAGFQVPANVALNVPNGGSLDFFQGQAPNEPLPGSRWDPCCSASTDVTGFQRETYRLAFTLEGRLSDNLRLTSITGYSDEEQFYDNDADYLGDKLFVFGNVINRDDFSQELRLSYDDTQLTVTGGLFYYQFENNFLNAGGGQFFLPPAIRSDTLPRTLGPFESNEKTRSYAAFGSVAYDFSDRFSASFDLRYNYEEKDFLYTSPGLDLDLTDNWDAFLPRFIVEFSPTDETLLYFNVARGFKTGGFNNQVNVFPAERTFAPENNWTYEIGAKQSFPDGSGYLNAALFYVDWTDQQVVQASAAGPNNNTIISNAAQSTSKGIELDGRWSPVRQLTLSASYAYVDARFDEFFDTAVAGLPGVGPGGDVSGNLIPRQSEHSAFGAIEYADTIVNSDVGYALRFDHSYQSTIFATSANLAGTGGQHRTNGRLTFSKGPARLSLWVDNIFDDRTPPVIIRFSDFASFFDPPVGSLTRAFAVTPGDGRTFGATLRLDF